MQRLFHYGLAAIGPIVGALAQFILSLLLLKTVSAADFGAFSFMLVVNQLAQGIWSALFCAPLLVAVTQASSDRTTARVAAIFQISFCLAILIGMAITGIAMALSLSTNEAALFGLLTIFGLARWLGRAHAYATGVGRLTNVSDIVYAVCVLLLTAWIFFTDSIDLLHALLLLMIATSAGFLLLLPGYWRAHRGSGIFQAWRHYRGAWTGQARWALTGVVTTEATANAHAYIVTSLLGVVAFAPLAATMLAIRPASVVMNALMEFERAQMARAIADHGTYTPAIRMVRFFRLVLVALWLANGVLVAILLNSPALGLLPSHYPTDVVATGMALWMLVLACRFARMPESTVLQAADQYRPLAWASVYACLFSVVAVTVLVLTVGPIWSIIGVATGEAAFAWWTCKAARSVLRARVSKDLQI